MPKKAAEKLAKSDLNKIAAIARMYHKGGKNQQEIAFHYHINQGEVSRCLQAAKEHGIVRTEIDPSFNDGLEGKVKEKFQHLKKVIIVPHVQNGAERIDPVLLQELGMECAEYLRTTVHKEAKIGISYGTAVEAVISALGTLGEQGVSLPGGCIVLPLTNKMSSMVTGWTQAALIAQLVNALPSAKGRAFQLPTLARDNIEAQIQAYRTHPEIQLVLSEIERMHHYIVGIGTIDYDGDFRPEEDGVFRNVDHGRHYIATHQFNELIRQLGLVDTLRNLKAVGEVLSQPFDRNGHFVIDHPDLHELKEIVLALPYTILCQHVQQDTASIIAVAGGKMKHAAIHAAIRAKVFNVLITDSATAAYILQEEGVQLD
jgi:deoxyribonucleoside regulator